MADRYQQIDPRAAQGSDYFSALLSSSGKAPTQQATSYYGNEAGQAALQQIINLTSGRAAGDPATEQALRDTLLNQARINTAQKAGQTRAAGGRRSAGMDIARSRVEQQAANEFAQQVAKSRLENAQVASQAAAQLASSDRRAVSPQDATATAAQNQLKSALGLAVGTGLGGIVAGLVGPQTNAAGELTDPTTGQTYESTDTLGQKAMRIGGSLLNTGVTALGTAAGGPLAGAATAAALRESGLTNSLQNAINDWRGVKAVSPAELESLRKARDIAAGETQMSLNAAPLGGIDAVPFGGPVSLGFSETPVGVQALAGDMQGLGLDFASVDSTSGLSSPDLADWEASVAVGPEAIGDLAELPGGATSAGSYDAGGDFGSQAERDSTRDALF